jgi:hypothetical protein
LPAESIFLIPIGISVAVISKGLEITGVIAKPIAHVLPVDMIGGFAVAQVLAIVLLLLVCFVAGLLARAAIARRLVYGLEANVLSRVPAYALLKTKTQSMLSLEDVMPPVVVRFDDAWQIALEIERIEGARSRSSYRAHRIPGPAPSALPTRTASRPLIYLSRSSQECRNNWAGGANEALRRHRSQAGAAGAMNDDGPAGEMP